MVLLVPIPQKDFDGIPIPRTRKLQAIHRLLVVFGAWYGSATALPSWGSWKSEPGAALSIDKGQSVLLVLTTPAKYRRHRSRLVRLLQREGRILKQEQMAAIAFKSVVGSVLIRCKT
jgi:hypothetical protein